MKTGMLSVTNMTPQDVQAQTFQLLGQTVLAAKCENERVKELTVELAAARAKCSMLELCIEEEQKAQEALKQARKKMIGKMEPLAEILPLIARDLRGYMNGQPYLTGNTDAEILTRLARIVQEEINATR